MEWGLDGAELRPEEQGRGQAMHPSAQLSFTVPLQSLWLWFALPAAGEGGRLCVMLPSQAPGGGSV